MIRSAALALCLLAIAGCTTTESAGEGPMDEALDAVKGGGGSPREKALAGWHRYLAEGNATQARELFVAAQDDLVGLAGQLELARRDLDIAARVQLAIRLATLGANHPLGRAGAHTMLDLVGQSPTLDQQLADGARAILKSPASPSVAFLARLVVARVAEERNEPGWMARFAEAGVVGEYLLAGPFGGLRLLDFPKVYPPETDPVIKDTYAVPVGEVRSRALHFPSGEVRLSGEPDRGDIFYLASDVTAQGGAYVLFTHGAAPHEVWIDGQKTLLRPTSTLEGIQQSASISLAAGPHRVLLKLSRAEGGQVAVFLVRGDGAGEDLHAHSASGPSPKSEPIVVAEETAPLLPVHAREVFASLAPELGKLAATFIAARDALPRNLEGSKVLLSGVEPFPETAPMLELRAQVTLSDRSLPDRTAKGRAGRDLEAATKQDPSDASAWLLRSGQARDGDQLDEAKTYLEKAAAAVHSPVVAVNQARLTLARGLDALADADARRALELLPGYCDAIELRYDVARRREAAADADALGKELGFCPDGPERLGELARARADLAAAEKFGQMRLERAPSNARVAAELAQVLVAAKRYPEAEKILAEQISLWPRNPDLHKRLAEVMTLAGDSAAALAEKRAALALDGADLLLRRQLALADGHDLLDQFAVDDHQVIAEFEKAPKPEGLASAASAFILDLAGVKILPDGTELERIHTIAKVIDQRGIPQLAEQHLPPNAVILKLQTLKKDGRVLEPEALGDKEGVSLPDVQVGDYVNIEYLSAVPPRSPAEPGWSSVPFYFRIADSPLFRSTYTVEAPLQDAVQVDAHNMEAPAPKKEGDHLVVHYEAHQVPLFIPEPGSPGGNEFLPFMQVGTGAGSLDVLLPFADSIVGRDAVTLEVQQFARDAVKEKLGVDAVRAIFQAVSEKVKGDANDINDRASLSLARERGSRLWLIKGALKAVGIPSHLALVRPLAADPAPYLFPNTDLFTYPVLHVEVPNEKPIWLDPSVRFGPFDELPDAVAGERDAVLLPEPGEAIKMVKTPPSVPSQPKQVKLHMALDAQGNVVADGTEMYSGFDAAFLRQALERYDELQRKQAVEVALARSFHGAALDKLEVRTESTVNAPVTLAYHFTSPHFARAETGKLVLGTPIFPLSLGQRFVSLATRTTPLLINGNEAALSDTRIDLPPGFKASALGDAASIESPFGSYKRAARVEGNVLILDEAAQINQGRIFPKVYPDFVKFTASVDQAQQQQMELSQ